MSLIPLAPFTELWCGKQVTIRLRLTFHATSGCARHRTREHCAQFTTDGDQGFLKIFALDWWIAARTTNNSGSMRVIIVVLMAVAGAYGAELLNADLSLSSSRCVRPLPRGFTGHVARPARSIRNMTLQNVAIGINRVCARKGLEKIPVDHVRVPGSLTGKRRAPNVQRWIKQRRDQRPAATVFLFPDYRTRGKRMFSLMQM
jgi:hypothetical protein